MFEKLKLSCLTPPVVIPITPIKTGVKRCKNVRCNITSTLPYRSIVIWLTGYKCLIRIQFNLNLKAYCSQWNDENCAVSHLQEHSLFPMTLIQDWVIPIVT